MKILENYDLTKFNTFGVPAKARFFVEIKEEGDIPSLFKDEVFKDNERLFLGGGSNVLFSKDFDGIVVLNNLKGIEILEETKGHVLIKAMGGEIWHDLVEFSVSKGYWGIENLSLIPGTVGAAPIQNIGAYGVELKDSIENVEAYEIETGEKKIFQKEECCFGYRDSIFKNTAKGKYFVSAIVVRLQKGEKRNVGYRALSEYLEKNNIEVKSSKDISDAVAFIRKSKLPDPAVIGNAGSFFKNVFVGREKREELQKEYPDIPYFKEEGKVKIPAGWLIEQCGWKGKREGNVGVHERQALVLVNFGEASGEDIKNLAEKISKSVFKKFGLKLEGEVNII